MGCSWQYKREAEVYVLKFCNDCVLEFTLWMVVGLTQTYQSNETLLYPTHNDKGCKNYTSIASNQH